MERIWFVLTLFLYKNARNRVIDWESVTDLETARKYQLPIQCGTLGAKAQLLNRHQPSNKSV